jgi:drug/metabolite transporter (DMT)-like permease
MILGTTFPIEQYLLHAGFSVNQYLSVKYLLAIVGLIFIYLLAKSRVTWQSIADGVILSFVIALAYWLQAEGLNEIPSSQSAFIAGLALVFTPVFASFLGHRLRLIHMGTAISALIGLYALVVTPGEPWVVNRGVLLSIASAAAFGLQISLMSRFCARSDVIVLALLQVIGAEILTIGTQFVFGEDLVPPMEALAQPLSIILILYCGLMATAFCFWAQSWAQLRLGPTEVALYYSLEPVFASLLAISGLIPGIQDHLTALQWVGAAIIVLSAVAIELLSRRRSASTAAG